MIQKTIIEKVKRSQIHKATYNPRTMTEARRAKLAVSLKEFGMVELLVWNRQTGNLVSGHQRLELLDAENMGNGGGDYELDVSVVEYDRDREKAANLALNSSELAGVFHEDQLQTLLNHLAPKFEFDLNSLIVAEEKKVVAGVKKILDKNAAANEPAPPAKEPGPASTMPATAGKVEQKNLPAAASAPAPDANAIQRAMELRKKELPDLLKRAEGQGLGLVKKDLEQAHSRAVDFDGALAALITSLINTVDELRREMRGVLDNVRATD